MKNRIRFISVLAARCPSCHKGRVVRRLITVRPRCPECGYNFYPEPGFYLGAMCVGFFLSALLTVPPLVVMKILDVDIHIMLAVPFVEFILVSAFLTFYSRILWLHLEYAMTDHLDGH